MPPSLLTSLGALGNGRSRGAHRLVAYRGCPDGTAAAASVLPQTRVGEMLFGPSLAREAWVRDLGLSVYGVLWRRAVTRDERVALADLVGPEVHARAMHLLGEPLLSVVQVQRDGVLQRRDLGRSPAEANARLLCAGTNALLRLAAALEPRPLLRLAGTRWLAADRGFWRGRLRVDAALALAALTASTPGTE